MHKRMMQGNVFGKTRHAHSVGIAEDEGQGGECGHRRAHGINKNVCKYMRKTREFAETMLELHVTFVSNNAYECRKPPSYVSYKCTYVPYDSTFGASDQGQTLDV